MGKRQIWVSEPVNPVYDVAADTLTSASYSQKKFGQFNIISYSAFSLVYVPSIITIFM